MGRKRHRTLQIPTSNTPEMKGKRKGATGRRDHFFAKEKKGQKESSWPTSLLGDGPKRKRKKGKKPSKAPGHHLNYACFKKEREAAFENLTRWSVKEKKKKKKKGRSGRGSGLCGREGGPKSSCSSSFPLHDARQRKKKKVAALYFPGGGRSGLPPWSSGLE